MGTLKGLATVFTFFLTTVVISHAFAAESASWTVLIYMAGQNNLSPACIEDVLEMMEVGSSEDVNVVVQADTSSQYTPEVPDHVTYRFKVLKGTLQPFPLNVNLDMGSPDTLSEFIRWGVASFPAARYALVLWDHGLGWLGGTSDFAGRSRGILEDDGSGSFMSLEELRQALQDGGVHFDLIEFDACLMAQVEVLGHVYEYADYVTFSENTEPGDGDPYDVILGRLVSNPNMDGKAFGKVIVEAFVDYYSKAPNNMASVTKSLVKTDGTGRLLGLLNGFGRELSSRLSTDGVAILRARERTQAFEAMKGVCDLLDFIDALLAQGVSLESASALKDFIVGSVIVENRYFSSPYSFGPGVGSGNMDRAKGIAINLPMQDDLTQSQLDEYRTLAESMGISDWYKFIKGFLGHEYSSPAPGVRGDFVIEAYWTDPFGGPSGADLDLYILEPDDVFAPWMGQTTPNGFFSPDSKDSGKDYEIYVARSEISRGSYVPVINYYDSWESIFDRAYCYLLYFPSGISYQYITYGPRPMGLWNPAPEVWDDYVIYLLSNNFYSDWWIPTVVEKVLVRAPIEVQREFWGRVRELKEARRRNSVQ